MRKKLLLADDSITIQKVVGIIFSSEDYELTIVDNGAAALAKARENIPDVLMLDAVMPGKTGYEVCEEIRRDPALKDIPILLMTGAFEPFDETKARQSGADDFISKPFESQHLTDKILNLVELAGKRSSSVQSPAPAAVEFVMPPVAEAVEPPRQAHPPLAEPAAIAMPQQSPAEGIEFFTMEEEPAPIEASRPVPPAASPAPAAPAPTFELEIVEGTSEDDLWGAFELEDLAVTEGATAEADSFEIETLGAGIDEAYEPTVLLEAGGEAELPEATADAGYAPSQFVPVEEEAFSFADEVEPPSLQQSMDTESFDQGGVFEEVPMPVFESGLAESDDFFALKGGAVAQEFVLETSPQIEQEFAGIQDPVPAAGTLAPPPAPLAAQEFDFQFAPEEPVSATETLAPVAPSTPEAVQEFDLQFASEEEYVPTPEALAPAVAVDQAAPVAPAAPAAIGGELSEEQLAALVAKISRDIIEKIAWEVVPDLAERIIAEEIRKIREGN